MTEKFKTAVARIALLESEGKTVSSPGGENKDGSFTLSVTISNDAMPSLRAQYEGQGNIGVTLEEYLREQVILPSIEAFQGAF